MPRYTEFLLLFLEGSLVVSRRSIREIAWNPVYDAFSPQHKREGSLCTPSSATPPPSRGFLLLLSVWSIPTSALSSRETRRKLPLDGRGSLHWNSGKGVDMSGPHDFLPEPLAPLYSDAEINGFFSTWECARESNKELSWPNWRGCRRGGPHFFTLREVLKSSGFLWNIVNRVGRSDPFFFFSIF